MLFNEPKKTLHLFSFLLLLIYVLLLIKTAWLGDDAYITFRTIDNFINGYGLRWNIAERVQSFTHPLWLFLLSLFYFFTREIYFTSLIVSIIISIITVYLLAFKVAKSFETRIIILFLIIFSKAFLDYSTSGLENPLTHLLLVLFVIVYFKEDESNKRIFLLSLISSLILTNRMDAGLLVLPALIAEVIKRKKKTAYLYSLLGFIPFISWEIFSIIYYGFPFPNTAYAKLNTGISKIELIEQGFKYYYSSFLLNPLTLLAIFSILVLSFINNQKKNLFISISIVIYLIYIVWIGGDFMNARFFVAPFVLSLTILAELKIPSLRILAFSLVSIIVITFVSSSPVPLNVNTMNIAPLIDKYGICDEALFYHINTGLIFALKDENYPKFSWIKDGQYLKVNEIKFERATNVGFIGYYAGKDCFILDKLALSDPLLARLPSKTPWRIGHFERDIPIGYEMSIAQNQNFIEDKNLSEFYNKLKLITQGSIWDCDRLGTIFRMNTGQYEYLLNHYKNSKK